MTLLTVLFGLCTAVAVVHTAAVLVVAGHRWRRQGSTGAVAHVERMLFPLPQIGVALPAFGVAVVVSAWVSGTLGDLEVTTVLLVAFATVITGAAIAVRLRAQRLVIGALALVVLPAVVGGMLGALGHQVAAL